jgi:uncharacterized repeat protein (TIGR03803 family)
MTPSAVLFTVEGAEHMGRWDLMRRAFSISLAAASLVGCGGSQPPIGVPGVTPQAAAIAPPRSAAHRLSASYQQLFRFHPPKNGTRPEAGLLDVNGAMYGTTTTGGLSRKGTVYRMSTSGVEKVLYRFRGGSDGSDPESGLIDVNGTLYGTTDQGGSGSGTVYSVSTSGSEKVLYAFKGGSDGAHPLAGLVDVKGTLYGTTSQGGGSGCTSTLTSGCGTVFSLTTSGQETVLHRFAGGSDGEFPSVGNLIDVNGVLYGTTVAGGTSYGDGTVYSITPAGAEKVLYAFQGQADGTDGIFPVGGLINVNGTLYGATLQGGSFSICSGGCGTVYSISTGGVENVLYRFTGSSDGDMPLATLIEVNGVLYGTTTSGGCCGTKCGLGTGCGTIYSVTTSGAETVLYRFAAGTDGFYPAAPLTNVSGTLYGTTELGGDGRRFLYGFGTLFTLSP